VSFANRIPFYGATYLCAEDPGVKRILKRLSRRCALYGFNTKFDLYAAKVQLNERGAQFEVHHRGKLLGTVDLPLSGRHNVLNALAAIAVALHLDISFETIADALNHFEGVGRRIEIKGEANGVLVVDDYGHHPTEIRATLAAVKARWPDRRLVVLFQPHRYSRTKLLAPEFSTALRGANQLLLMPIYAAGEKPLRGVTTDLIAKRLPANKRRAWSWDQPISTLSGHLRPNDLLLTLGAGDVWKAGEQILKQNQQLSNRLEQAFPALNGRIKNEEPLSRHATWGIGGPAEAFVDVHTRAEFVDIVAWCRVHRQPLFILGWGSNVLLPDAGLRGVVIRLRGDFESIRFEKNHAWVGAGVHLPKLSKAAAEQGLSGVEALAGVPGTVGGALITNAGTPRGVIGDVLNSVDVLERDGTVTTLNLDQIELSYRHTNLAGKFILSAGLRLSPDDKAIVTSRMKQDLESRAKTQPLGTKNVGSVFRNPPNDHAARLIEAAGLKGKAIGRMRFSPKHANFIENTGGATAANALELIRTAKQTVKEKFHVDLTPEVIVVTQPEPLH
jgi:UDP-N-acetylenolpyruvoylglucosamine reductase